MPKKPDVFRFDGKATVKDVDDENSGFSSDENEVVDSVGVGVVAIAAVVVELVTAEENAVVELVTAEENTVVVVDGAAVVVSTVV